MTLKDDKADGEGMTNPDVTHVEQELLLIQRGNDSGQQTNTMRAPQESEGDVHIVQA